MLQYRNINAPTMTREQLYGAEPGDHNPLSGPSEQTASAEAEAGGVPKEPAGLPVAWIVAIIVAFVVYRIVAERM